LIHFYKRKSKAVLGLIVDIVIVIKS